MPLSQFIEAVQFLSKSSFILDNQVASGMEKAFFLLLLANRRKHCSLQLEEDLAIISHAFLNSRLDHCNLLYLGLHVKALKRLQLVQNVAAWFLNGLGPQEHITYVLKTLYLHPFFYSSIFQSHQQVRTLLHQQMHLCPQSAKRSGTM